MVDKEGRWILLQLKNDEMTFWILNIYTPLRKKTLILGHPWETVTSHPNWRECDCRGDFNLPLDPILDRHSGVKYKLLSAHRARSLLIKHLILLDPWRRLNPTGREFTFYSPTHNLYSCIDYLLTSQAPLPALSKVYSEPICLSGHACIWLDMIIGNATEPPPKWRLNVEVFNIPQSINRIERIMHKFIQCNDPQNSLNPLYWDAFKATVSGECISTMAQVNKASNVHFTQLAKELKRLERLW